MLVCVPFLFISVSSMNLIVLPSCFLDLFFTCPSSSVPTGFALLSCSIFSLSLFLLALFCDLSFLYHIVCFRVYRIDASIVRIMKARRSLPHVQLVTEVVHQLEKRFRPDPSLIKTRIEALIQQEYETFSEPFSSSSFISFSHTRTSHTHTLTSARKAVPYPTHFSLMTLSSALLFSSFPSAFSHFPS